MSRIFTIIEIDGRGYVASPVPCPESLAWQMVLARRDGTEPSVVSGLLDGSCWCSCGKPQPCKHVRALQRAGLLARETAPRAVEPHPNYPTALPVAAVPVPKPGALGLLASLGKLFGVSNVPGIGYRRGGK